MSVEEFTNQLLRLTSQALDGRGIHDTHPPVRPIGNKGGKVASGFELRWGGLISVEQINLKRGRGTGVLPLTRTPRAPSVSEVAKGTGLFPDQLPKGVAKLTTKRAVRRKDAGQLVHDRRF